MHHVREVERTANVASRGGAVPSLPADPIDLDEVRVGDGVGGTWTVAEMLEYTSTDGIMVLAHGRVVYERWFGTLRPEAPHLCHSITKSLASCIAANLVDRELLDPRAAITAYVPELAGSAYGDATVRHLLDMTVGIRYTEDHEDDETEDGRLDRLCGVKPSRAPDEPGSAYDYATTTVKEGEHGRVLHYVSLNTDVLGWVMERATGSGVPELIAREVWSKLGAEDDAYIALDGAGSAQLDGGFCCSLRDLARFGLMLLQGGAIDGRRVVPAWWIDDIRDNGDKAAFAAAPDCGLLPRGWSYRSAFWVGERTDHIPFMALGMYGQMVYVHREAGVAAVKFSSQPRPADDVLVTRTFLALEDLVAVLAKTSG
jgi:CubicO group peptidase (beta-lactamase class C family)